ncbi:MAG: erythronate-4-phosphate dehydrogenase, partial [Muribaculaceae bacterium]
MSKLQIVADAYIPYLEPLAQIADVKILAPEDITREAVADADALLVRTRTRCDEALLGGSRVRFVGTATIGHDHIDLDWCRRAGIVATNAPGCNAPAVA